MANDFFTSKYGNYRSLPWWRKRGAGPVVDALYDVRLGMNKSYRELEKGMAQQPALRVLITGVEVPSRASDMDRVMADMASAKHQVVRKKAELHKGKGKFQNINLGLAGLDVNEFDWLLVIDDDVSLPRNFLDKFLYLSESAELKLCQPAHKVHSYISYGVTQRHWNSLVRTTRFVECGPITAFRREMFPLVVPFPELRWAWGNDVAWAELARRHGYRIGIVDGTPIGHLRPVAGSYSGQEARDEGEAYLNSCGVELSRFEALQTEAVFTSLEAAGRGVAQR
jgi:hypothetical protein